MRQIITGISLAFFAFACSKKDDASSLMVENTDPFIGTWKYSKTIFIDSITKEEREYDENIEGDGCEYLDFIIYKADGFVEPNQFKKNKISGNCEPYISNETEYETWKNLNNGTYSFYTKFKNIPNLTDKTTIRKIEFLNKNSFVFIKKGPCSKMGFNKVYNVEKRYFSRK